MLCFCVLQGRRDGLPCYLFENGDWGWIENPSSNLFAIPLGSRDSSYLKGIWVRSDLSWLIRIDSAEVIIGIDRIWSLFVWRLDMILVLYRDSPSFLIEVSLECIMGLISCFDFVYLCQGIFRIGGIFKGYLADGIQGFNFHILALISSYSLASYLFP
ncbi:PREDICTED: uncharacterized protein LOC104765829 [Camelina sativa]|uniref:Uncharacterized protein LOC104765829 n=1 Tax=Camelina sativa TaxID=90675 RepID=A0ABM0XLZ4_CAMSA|nr:PREDICTED: uncharacterized protein LOC104765829 [Camelina sativa]